MRETQVTPRVSRKVFINRLETAPEGQRNALDMSQSVRMNETDEESKIGMEYYQQGGLSTDPPVAVTGLFTSPMKRLVRRRPGAPPDKTSESGDAALQDLRECEGHEHLAGAGCQHHSGHCGFEHPCRGNARLCYHATSCFGRPQNGLQSRMIRNASEAASDFLSGLCDPMPSRDVSGPSNDTSPS